MEVQLLTAITIVDELEREVARLKGLLQKQEQAEEQAENRRRNVKTGRSHTLDRLPNAKVWQYPWMCLACGLYVTAAQFAFDADLGDCPGFLERAHAPIS